MKYFSLFFVLFSNLVYGQVNYIPPQAFQYKEVIKKEVDTYFPTVPDYNYTPSLIEHESCISLKHKRCWNPQSRLKSTREEGAGLGQITRAYKADGTLRFDSLAGMRDRYKQELKDAKWETIYQRPDIQIRMMVLMVRDDYKKLYNVEDPISRLQMVDASYNGGLGGLLKERRACGLANNCNPGLWFGNVEKFCLKSKKAIYDTRTPCDINRHHVHDVFHNKLPKYNKQYFTKEI
jgi:hypothetical protein